MLDQSFSTNNFENIFDRENRKGKIKKEYLSKEYNTKTDEINKVEKEISELLKKKKKDRNEEDINIINEQKQIKRELINNRKEILINDLHQLSEQINADDFKIKLKTDRKIKDKQIYTIEDSKICFFAVKQLQFNIKKIFNVKQGDRHIILSQIKLLLNNTFPKYVIRTDIDKFFESIPQDQLLQKIENDNILSLTSRKMIKDIISEYENLKDKTIYEEGFGIPRGIGISSYLSELYMKEIDNRIKIIPDVIYYARYVDDILIIINPISNKKGISYYFSEINDIVKDNGLNLKAESDEKCILGDLTINNKCDFDYLGYRINIRRWIDTDGGKKVYCKALFGLSNNKKEKIKDRICKIIQYFNSKSEHDISKARKDLLLCLKFICGNMKLKGAKNGVKIGIYYSNDLLDKEYTKQITAFTNILKWQSEKINPYSNLFTCDEDKLKYIDKLKKRIDSFDFKQAFETKKEYSFSISEIQTIKKILQ